jgi:hypothetical protein
MRWAYIVVLSSIRETNMFSDRDTVVSLYFYKKDQFI